MTSLEELSNKIDDQKKYRELLRTVQREEESFSNQQPAVKDKPKVKKLDFFRKDHN